jgi:hypothetical protein
VPEKPSKYLAHYNIKNLDGIKQSNIFNGYNPAFYFASIKGDSVP